MLWSIREMELLADAREEGLEEGRAEGEAKGREATNCEHVKTLTEKLNIPAEKAMELLGVSKEDLPDHKTI